MRSRSANGKSRRVQYGVAEIFRRRQCGGEINVSRQKLEARPGQLLPASLSLLIIASRGVTVALLLYFFTLHLLTFQQKFKTGDLAIRVFDKRDNGIDVRDFEAHFGFGS